MKILVIGGTGTVGRSLTRELVERGADVRVVTRDPDKARDGVEAVAGDLADPASLALAFDEIEAAYLLTPLVPDEADLGRNAVATARDAGLPRLVFQSVHRVDEGAHVPHFATKIEIRQAIEAAGIPHAVVAPNSFYQNDARARQAIVEHGVYPLPIGGVGVQSVDARDIAACAAAALLDPAWVGRTIPVVGPRPWTGEAVAGCYSGVLGRPVRYGGDDLDDWKAGVAGLMPDWLIEDLAIMYEHYQAAGLVAAGDDLDVTREALGREPRTLEAYARELVG